MLCLEAYKLDKEVLNTKGEEVHFFCANNVKYKLSNSQKIYAVFKRLFDILFSFLAILFLSPLFILLAFAVKLTSKGSVIFRQERKFVVFDRITVYTIQHLEKFRFGL